MKYILITDDQIIIKKSISALNKEVKAELKPELFELMGNYRVCKLTEKELEKAIDLKTFMSIPGHKLFKRESSIWGMLPVYLMLAVVLLQGCVK